MRLNDLAEAPVTEATTFKLKAQLLEQGRTDEEILRTDNLWARLKVYASGGENVLHAHPIEDHMFLILQGRATFYDKEGQATELGKYEGILLPAMTYYWFCATGDEPLVLFRLGARAGEPPKDFGAGVTRVDVTGAPIHGESEANKEVPVIFRDGAYFG